MKTISLMLCIVILITTGCTTSTGLTDANGNALSSEEAQAIIDEATKTEEPSPSPTATEKPSATLRPSASASARKAISEDDIPEDSAVWWDQSADAIRLTLEIMYDYYLDETCQEWLEAGIKNRRDACICIAVTALCLDQEDPQAFLDAFVVEIDNTDYRKKFMDLAKTVFNVLSEVAASHPDMTLREYSLVFRLSIEDLK